MNDLSVFPIGKIINTNDNFGIILEDKYKSGLKGLQGFSHVQVLWWCDKCDTPETRAALIEKLPYTKGPAEMGVFAMHSPERPNPIAVSAVGVAFVDEASGTIGLHYIDAFDGSPVLDIKPYVPSVDRVESPQTPEWCAHWPKSCEESAYFDWDAEFNF